MQFLRKVFRGSRDMAIRTVPRVGDIKESDTKGSLVIRVST